MSDHPTPEQLVEAMIAERRQKQDQERLVLKQTERALEEARERLVATREIAATLRSELHQKEREGNQATEELRREAEAEIAAFVNPRRQKLSEDCQRTYSEIVEAANKVFHEADALVKRLEFQIGEYEATLRAMRPKAESSVVSQETR